MILSKNQNEIVRKLIEEKVEKHEIREQLITWLFDSLEYKEIHSEFRMKHFLDFFAITNLRNNKYSFVPRGFLNILKIEIDNVVFATKNNLKIYFEEIIYLLAYFIPQFFPYCLIGAVSKNMKLNSEFNFKLFANLNFVSNMNNYTNDYFQNFLTNDLNTFESIFDKKLSTEISSLFFDNEKERIMLIKDESGLKIIVKYSRFEHDVLTRTILPDRIEKYDVVETWETKSNLIERCLKAIELISQKFDNIANKITNN
ncbi:hypothetical protein EI74_0805 [Mycoplasma testudineum]|uniref:Uncharacterized protein n=1 Tax=Mycoplasma testudineum TaxID=244584 RepID=A0A4R6IBR8_9MOLU|nr:hypothetical protein [Mycoplasma testudineum]OYD26499.1 hypothetical protein CG473_03595 [Mycoplasma testudineum]TDO18987.1 hypothetical protein EI74_0805 [Mycoplasma testudineum]